MKKTFIIVINVIIMSAILIFVVLYSGFTSRDSYRRQIEHFVNTTVTMEQVTENYMEGEQRVCDVSYECDHRSDGHCREESRRCGVDKGKPQEDQSCQQSSADSYQRHSGHLKGRERKTEAESPDILGNRLEAYY